MNKLAEKFGRLIDTGLCLKSGMDFAPIKCADEAKLLMKEFAWYVIKLQVLNNEAEGENPIDVDNLLDKFMEEEFNMND